jgi:hypothetical protein
LNFVQGYFLAEQFETEDFYRLKASCRLAALARIREGAGAAGAVGWPENVREFLL